MNKLIYCVRILVITLSFIALSVIDAAAKTNATDLLARLKHNVVSINAQYRSDNSQDGFGFIIAEEANSLYIATAKHLLVSGNPDDELKNIFVKFSTYQMDDYPADLVYMDSKYDFAIIKTARLEGVSWVRKCLGSKENLKRDQEVWFIGKYGRLHLSANPGRINAVMYYNTIITIEGFEIAPGTSGAPIICEDGIIGMIVRHTGTDVEGITIPLIKDIVIKSDRPWNLQKTGTKYRTGFYTGIGFGVGQADIQNENIEGAQQSRTGIDLEIRLGWAYSDNLMIGFENEMWYRSDDGQIYRHDSYAMLLTYYFGERSYIKLGPSYVWTKAEPLAIIKKESGIGFVGGIGAEYQLNANLTAGPGITIVYHKLDNVSVIYGSLALNFTWFL
ncbi:MAG: trypsin-like peptidase domain-containing protein [FCB group bacterium]|nr:trypsin-like peptidase domain-containing protein [FCB group bacterium]